MTGRELAYIAEAHSCGHLAGDGPFTRRSHAWLEQQTGCRKALLTPSCTAALEMMALLLDIEEGDEVILPSYTFVSTANAFVLRGGVPVFVDIRPDTLNIDETRIVDAITPRTKAIVPVHYAGVACEMDAIMKIATHHNLAVVEDAAQGAIEPPRHVRRLQFLERMGSCQVVHRGGTRRSCVSGGRFEGSRDDRPLLGYDTPTGLTCPYTTPLDVTPRR